jgi:hypothetical protein
LVKHLYPFECRELLLFDVSLTGFDLGEIDDLFKDSLKDGIKDDDFDVDAELQKPAVAKLGDPETYEDIGLVIEMPRSSFTDTALDNLKRLVESKSNLIKKALGTETLELEITDDKVRFPWFEDDTNPDAVKAYTHFVTALCEMARVQKRVTAKEKETSNDKYAFRCFLLRLGFIGAAYKEERKILLRNLTGSSAFKTPKSEVIGDE